MSNQISKFSDIAMSLPIVVSLLSVFSSTAFMSGKYLQKIDHNSSDSSELHASLNEMREENKKLWAHIVKQELKDKRQEQQLSPHSK